MRSSPTPEKRLELLNAGQPGRPWSSDSERRQCVVCESVFRGDEVIIHPARQQLRQLACPTCGSAPAAWVRLGNPLTDENVWADWELSMALAGRDSEDEVDGEVAAAG